MGEMIIPGEMFPSVGRECVSGHQGETMETEQAEKIPVLYSLDFSGANSLCKVHLQLISPRIRAFSLCFFEICNHSGKAVQGTHYPTFIHPL